MWCGLQRCARSPMLPRSGDPSLTPWRFDIRACQADLLAFEQLLATKAELTERRDILPFFHAHPHLAVLLGSYHPNSITPDRLGLEMPLFGAFQADVVVGNWSRYAYCFVELEDGQANSIFVHRGRQSSTWASRFERGFSQIVDWLWLLDDQRQTAAFENLFGTRHLDVVTLLVIGRTSSISSADRRRFVWRRDRVMVNSQRVYCCTYDELLEDLRQRLRSFALEARTDEP